MGFSPTVPSTRNVDDRYVDHETAYSYPHLNLRGRWRRILLREIDRGRDADLSPAPTALNAYAARRGASRFDKEIDKRLMLQC